MLDIQCLAIATMCSVGTAGSAALPSYLEVGLWVGRVLHTQLLRLLVLLDILDSQLVVGCD